MRQAHDAGRGGSRARSKCDVTRSSPVSSRDRFGLDVCYRLIVFERARIQHRHLVPRSQTTEHLPAIDCSARNRMSDREGVGYRKSYSIDETQQWKLLLHVCSSLCILPVELAHLRAELGHSMAVPHQRQRFPYSCISR
ncbi:hypothetical protein EVAR_92150_1 [Eumeta japonica]|uniref:Uncharacterized protein n=1 Tax=Eumeta variegata TaxID=151549 RepID=A0A4C1T168_EUMVA|nr:hypothetical protein EVAR_92150_1 [Eumeta japonica]